jgi:DNA-binding MarR family transcriptional regulator
MSNNPTSYQGINAQDCCFGLRKATRAITQFYDRHLEPADIRATQFTLLLTLTNATGKTLTEMAEGLVMDRTTLTRNLKPLEKAGFIITTKLPDRRTKGYVLTEKGRQAIEKGIPLWRKAQQHIVGQVGNDRYSHFLEELDMVRSLVNANKLREQLINSHQSLPPVAH